MVIGRDIIPVHIINTYTQFPATTGGGGGSAVVSPATTSGTGNYNNAVKIAIWDGSGNQSYNYSNGIKDGSNSTFGTASSPTRTTQTVPIPASDYHSGYSSYGTGGTVIIIGGYIRTSGYTSASKFTWDVSGTIVASSLSNGCTVSSFEVRANNQNQQDNTTMGNGGINNGFGIYNINTTTQNFAKGGTGFYMWAINHGSGRGTGTLPASGDYFTIRITVSDEDSSGTTYSGIHDVTIEFT